jgi:hypothetical protein
MADPNNFFDLTHAADDSPGEAVDEIPELEPNSVMTIEQDFRVNDNALEFSDGFLTLDLMFSDPTTGKMRSVMKYRMAMQLSGLYRLSPNPSFLLVVNSKTPNHAIHQIITLVRHGLYTSLDIFNLSLTGSYESPVTGENVLESYYGKSVIIFGNTFPFFDNGACSPWDILDPSEIGLLTQFRTSILFAGVDDWAGLATFIAKAVFPTVGAVSTPATQKSIKGLVSELREANEEAAGADSMLAHRIPVKKGLFSSLQSKTEGAARSAAKRLNKNMPLRRFVAVPDMAALEESTKEGGIVVSEGAPRTTHIWACAGQFAQSATAVADYHMFSIFGCLPFDVRVRMFWNMAVGDRRGSHRLRNAVFRCRRVLHCVTGNPSHGQRKDLVSPRPVHSIHPHLRALPLHFRSPPLPGPHPLS